MKKITTLCTVLLTLASLAQAQDSSVPSSGIINTVENVKALVHYRNNERGTQPVTLSCDTLQTTFAGGNNHRGNMFDLTALNTITIWSMDGSPMSNTGYEIYYKTGTYVGSENNPSAWTLLGSNPTVVSNGSGIPTPLGIMINLTIPQGQTYGFYVSSTNTSVSQDYTDGTSVGNVFASDANLQYHEGCGLEYPFSNSPFTPRIWNGRIHYCPGTTTGTQEQTLSIMKTKVLPNPFSTSAYIHLDNGNFTSGMQVKIYDVVGNEVSSLKELSGNDVRIERGTLNAGLYFYSIVENNTVLEKGKMIIQ